MHLKASTLEIETRGSVANGIGVDILRVRQVRVPAAISERTVWQRVTEKVVKKGCSCKGQQEFSHWAEVWALDNGAASPC